MQELVAETQAERNNRENKSHFREQPAEQNSSPVDSCADTWPCLIRVLLGFRDAVFCPALKQPATIRLRRRALAAWHP